MNIKRKQELQNYLFILPIVILFLGIVIYPLIYNIIISFYDWNGISIAFSLVAGVLLSAR